MTIAKAYRLLHAVMATAWDDRLIKRNPCRIKGAGQEDSAERPVVAMPDLVRLVEAIPVRYRAMVLLATFASLRFGELAALRRGDIDLRTCEVRVARSLIQMNDGRLRTIWSSSGRRAVGSAVRTSATSGSMHATLPSCPAFTCTTCATPETRWRRPPALACAS